MKIGFIAMSGVRALNPELTRLGLTLPGFVERNKTIASLPSLGLLTLAGLTPARFDVAYHEIQDLRQRDSLPDDFDLVAISTFTAQVKEAWEVADHFRARRIPVILGGITAGALVNECLAHCDSVAIGEGEPLWPRVLADLERGALQRCYRASDDPPFDLKDAPLPRFDLLDPAQYNRLTVQTARGCPHRCAFCASSILLTPHYKTKPVPNILAEIHAIQEIWPRPFIEFADDNSFVHRAHARDLLRALAPEGLRWFTETDISVADDPDLLGLMRDGGCQQILVGLESPRRQSLQGIELRGDWKLRRQDRYLAAIERIQSRGITVNGCFILGLDGDTPEVFDDVLRFVRRSGLYEVQVTFLTPFPGTPLYTRLLEEGRILQPGAWERCTLFDINFVPRQMSGDQLQEGFLRLVRTLYSAEETAGRRRAFRQRLRQVALRNRRPGHRPSTAPGQQPRPDGERLPGVLHPDHVDLLARQTSRP